MEIEFKQEWAKKVGDLLSKSSFEDWRDKCTGYLRDYVDFVDTNGGRSNKTRSDLLPWWSDFVGDVGKAGPKREKKAEGNLLAKSKRYLERMAPTFYTQKHGFGVGISLDKAVEEAKYQLSDRHQNKLKRLKELVKSENN